MWRVWNLLPSSMNRPLPGASVQKPSRKSRKLQSPAATSTPQPPTLTHSAQCDQKSLAACSELVKKCFYFVIVVLDNSELHAPDIDTCCSDDLSSSEEVVTQTGSCHTFQHHRNSKSEYWNILSTYQQNLYRYFIWVKKVLRHIYKRVWTRSIIPLLMFLDFCWG